jgi:hypothetical protein
MKSDHIVGAAASLLGVALLTGRAEQTISDEMAFAAALMFIGSCLASHRAIITGKQPYERVAEWLFPLGVITLTFAVLIFWF